MRRLLTYASFLMHRLQHLFAIPCVRVSQVGVFILQVELIVSETLPPTPRPPQGRHQQREKEVVALDTTAAPERCHSICEKYGLMLYSGTFIEKPLDYC